MADKFLKLLSGFFLGTLIISSLGPEIFGKMTYVQSILAILSVFSLAGLEPVLIKKLNTSESFDIVANTLAIRLAFTAFVLIFLLFFVFKLVDDPIETKLYFIFSFLLFFMNFNVAEQIHYSLNNSKLVGYVSIFSTFIGAVLKLYGLHCGFGVLWFSSVIVVELFLNVSIFWAFLGKRICRLSNVNFNVPSLMKDLKSGLPLMLSGGAVILYMKSDQLMIDYFMGGERVGVYSSATRLVEALYFLPLILANVLFPVIYRGFASNESESWSKYIHFLNKSLYFSFFFCVFVFILNDDIIAFLYPSEFKDASTVLSIYAFVLPFVFLGVFSGKMLVLESLEKIVLTRSIQGCLLNLILNYIFIPIYGINGAAFATLLSQVYSTHISIFFNERSKHIFYYNCLAFTRFKRS